jgi:hypothetical protein
MLVLTRSSPTNLIITAQDSRNIRPHSLHKGPKVQPKHRLITNHGIHHLTALLLLVANVMLSARLCTRILNPANGLLHGDAVEVRVAAKALPVPSPPCANYPRGPHTGPRMTLIPIAFVSSPMPWPQAYIRLRSNVDPLGYPVGKQ